MRFYFVVVVVLLVNILEGNASKSSPTVNTAAGTFIGTAEVVKGKSVGLKSFLGIPYAQPPVGRLRFKKPIPLQKLEEPFRADQFGAACRQVAIPNMATPLTQSEDCLFLNIYVPDHAADTDTGHAVMVFIHGGAYIVGSGENYRGDKLAVHGNVIVVTINYRLGIFGFFGTGDEDAPGNLGFWDQRQALQWVHDNIKGFGGDAERVTIFGESAGGTSVIYQALYPPNKGLFQRMVSHSGAPSANMGINTSPWEVTTFVSEQFECGTKSLKKSIVCLQDKETDQVMDKLNKIMEQPDNITKLRFHPLIDGELVKLHPGSLARLSMDSDLEQVKFFRSIDTIFGCNSQEGGMFVAVPFAFRIEDPENFLPTREEFETQIIPVLIGLEFGPYTHKVVQSLFINQYTDWSDPNSPEAVRQQFLDLWGDVIFNVAAVELGQLHANSSQSAKTYFYHLEATPTTPLLRKMSWLKGANHADDLGFIFGFNTDVMAANQTFTEPLPWEHELSDKMMTYWSNFAKSGNPNSQATDSVNLPTWPVYDVNKRHINLDKEISIGHHLWAKRVDFWLNVLPNVMASLDDASQQKSKDSFEEYCSTDGDCGGD